MVETPVVGVVVVNFNGGDRTLRCIEALNRSSWPQERLRIVLVDNGSSDGVVASVRTRWPHVDIVETGSNLGFGAGCNRGMVTLGDADYIALMNNDAVPDPGWLEPLVGSLVDDPCAGAATPKVLLSGWWRELVVASDASAIESDPRALGVQVGAITVDGDDVTSLVKWGTGFWGAEVGGALGSYRWTNGDATAIVPSPSAEGAELAAAVCFPPGERKVTLTSGDDRSQVVAVPAASVASLHAAGPPCRVVNNVGTVRLDDGSVADRGFLELDTGQYDRAEDVTGWSGAAVLLRRSYLDDVGGFDERLFLYYEDADLSWRGARRGWRYRYVPESVVFHDHSATTSQMPALVRHLSARNRLVVLTKLAPGRLVVAALVRFCGDVARTVRVDVLRRLARGKRPHVDQLVLLLRIGAGYLRLAPAALRFRLRR